MRRVLPCVLAVVACSQPRERPDPVPGEPAVTGACADAEPGFATCVASFDPSASVSFGHDEMPDIVLGPPQPPESGAGTLDVASLGCGGRITLGFANGVPDGPGADLIVFENAFYTPGLMTFAEPAEVLVSDDGELWYAFGCDVASADGCAGVTPTEPVDAAAARDPDRSGGDAFDLEELALDRIAWVRIIDRTREHYDDDMWCGGMAGGFDLDAVARVHDP